jgi:hypothetical protein
MLTIARKQIVEKVIANAEGVLFRVWFVVSNENGKVTARPIRAEQLGSVEDNEVKIALPCAKVKNVCNFAAVKAFVDKIVSPYTSILRFTCTIPRGPNL